MLATEVVVAVADGVIVAAYDDEFHVGVGHGVSILFAVVGDADDFTVAVEMAYFLDDDRHIGRIVVDSGVDSLFNHVLGVVHRFVEFLDGELGSGVEAFHVFFSVFRG